LASFSALWSTVRAGTQRVHAAAVGDRRTGSRAYQHHPGHDDDHQHVDDDHLDHVAAHNDQRLDAAGPAVRPGTRQRRPVPTAPL
jgi:hypothetical protein